MCTVHTSTLLASKSMEYDGVSNAGRILYSNGTGAPEHNCLDRLLQPIRYILTVKIPSGYYQQHLEYFQHLRGDLAAGGAVRGLAFVPRAVCRRASVTGALLQSCE